jgi:CSLREA domain-containing protein
LLLGGIACATDQTPTAPTSAVPGADRTVLAASQKVVNSLVDPGDGTCNAAECTLREAIKASGTTAITFASGLSGTITLAEPAAGGGPLQIGTSLTITGPPAVVTIRRRTTDPAFRIMRVGGGTTVTLKNLTVRNGRANILGAGIANFGALTLINCTVTGNVSTDGGGGIENMGPLTLVHSTVSDNSAPFGGGIDNVRTRLVARGSVITRNSGGGVGNRAGELALSNTTVSDNLDGFGVAEDRSTSTLDRVRITGNKDGGYALHQGTTKITNSTIARNSGAEGAGILNSGGGNLTIAKSSIVNNAASGRGGGILNLDDPFGRVGADITLVNSTVTGNSAEAGGGIMINDRGSAGMVIINSTVAGNSAQSQGGGILLSGFNEDSPGVSLTNTIVAQNTAPQGRDLFGTFSARFNLIGDGTGSNVTNTDGNQVGKVAPHSGLIDPRLGPLADNGGATRTRALLSGSPAIDAATSDGCPGRDQRDVSRPQGAACDIGSYERE